jgi:hypothetical protein
MVGPSNQDGAARCPSSRVDFARGGSVDRSAARFDVANEFSITPESPVGVNLPKSESLPR